MNEFQFRKGTIYINSRSFPVVIGGTLSHEKIVELSECGMNPADCTIAYNDWKSWMRRKLEYGHSVHIEEDGMSFTVTYTGPIL